MRGNLPLTPQLLPEATALPGAFPRPVLWEDKFPPGPRRRLRGGRRGRGLTRGAEAEAGGDGRVFCELQSDDNQ